MKVRKKPKEQTAMEKRNTAIFHFTLVALAPLLLALFLGFSLKKTDIVNKDNLQKKLNEVTQDYKQLNQQLFDLNSAFSQADQYQDKFINNDSEKLKNELKEVESQISLKDWERDMKDSLDRFKHEINQFDRPWDFKDNEQTTSLLRLGKKWLREIAKTKDREFLVRQVNHEQKILREEETISDDGTDLSSEVQGLRMELMQKDFDIRSLNAELEDYQNDAEEGEKELLNKLSKAKSRAEKAKADVTTQIDEIREALESLEGQKFLKLKSDTKKMAALKNQLNLMVDKIERHLIELN